MKENTLSYYDHNAREIAGRYEQINFRGMQNDLLARISGRRRVLEIGCGSGREAAFLFSQGVNIVATDGSRAMLAEAAKLHPELDGRLLHHELPAPLPFPDNEFDAAYSIAVLMHLKRNEIEQVMRDVHRVLERKGLFFFSVSLERADVEANDLDKTGRRFTLLSVSDWSDTFCSCGFLEIRRNTNTDSVGRDGFLWGSFLLEKPEKEPPAADSNPFVNIDTLGEKA